MGEEPGTGASAGDRVIGRRRRNDRVASPARQLLADMPDHLEAAGHIIERLGDLLADPNNPALSCGWLDAAPDGDNFVGSYGRVFDVTVLGRPGDQP